VAWAVGDPYGDVVAERVVLVRHGATAWSSDRRHTGRTDIPLDEVGRARAAALAPVLAALPGADTATILTSPLERAAETCRLAGFGDRAEIDDDLVEWDYGAAEGLRTDDIRVEHPGWSVWTHRIEGGETIEQVGARADNVIARIDDFTGLVIAFAHAHVLRVLAVRWCGLAPVEGRRLTLEPASISMLGYEREARVIDQWNVTHPLPSF